MAEQAKPRVFVIEGRNFDDPDPGMTVDQVKAHYTSFFPELANADTHQHEHDGKMIYEFVKKVGTKG
jgi:PRTRC genetic system protein C